MKRFVFAFASVVLVYTSHQTMAETEFPTPFVVVGEPTAGEKELPRMKTNGISAKPDFAGRAAGITTFCQGHADAMILMQKLDPSEEATCREHGGDWRVFPTQRDTFIYVTLPVAELLLAKP